LLIQELTDTAGTVREAINQADTYEYDK